MNILFTNSVLLPLAILVAVPLILHLFARARPPVFAFSSIEFLQRVLRQSVRIKKPQSLLVLVLRTVLFAALIGMFLKPVFFANQPLPGLGVRKDVVLVIDGTASMAASEGGQTRFVAACARGVEILDGLSGADTANILWLGAPNRTEFPKLGANIGYLKKALRQAVVSYEGSDVSAALAQAADLLRGRDGAREIYVLSDFQSTTWQNVTFPVPPGIRVYTLKIGEAQLPNLALTSVSADPPRPLAGQEVKIFCEVNNFSADPAVTTVYLRAGESHQSQEVRLSAWQKAPVVFTLKTTTPGEQVVDVSLGEDAFPADNERWAVLDVVKELNIGVAGGETETADYWRRAFRALEWANPVTLPEADLERDIQLDALWLAGSPKSARAGTEIHRYLERGGMVVWYPGMAADAASLRQLLPATVFQGEAFWEKAQKPWHLRLADPASQLFEVFASGTYGDPARGVFAGRVHLPELKGATAIFKYEDDVPALSLIRQGGALLLWNLPLQREVSDWALHPEFVPFLGELILQHRLSLDPGRASTFLAGQVLTHRFETDVLDKDVQLLRGDAPVNVVRRAGAGVEFAAQDSRVPGVYSWHYRGALLARQALNFPPLESDLRSGPTPDFGQPGVVRLSGRRTIAEMREGQPLWPWLLLLGLLVACVEGFVLLRVDKS